MNLRGTQLPNLSGNSEIRSSLIRSLSGPRMMTGRVYSTCKRWTVSYDNTASSDAILRIEKERQERTEIIEWRNEMMQN